MSAADFDYWAFFTEDARRIGSPLYARISEGICADAELKALAARARPGQPHPNMILGAVHFLLLRGAEHPLRRLYPDLGGVANSGEDPFPLFKDFVGKHREAVTKLIETRVTNTNEVGRSAVLQAGFRMLQGPLHLIEIGPSAGLNMIWDRYGANYGKFAIAPDAPLVVDCELRGDKLPPTGPAPKVASRIGLELNPVDLTNEDDRDWLRALMWPDQVSRLHRLERAIELFKEVHPPIRHGDALALLPDALAEAPAGATICVYHTIVLYQFSGEAREALDNLLTVAGLRRPVARLAFEFDAQECALRLIRYHDGVRDETKLAKAHPHGVWLEWLV
ncbi:MAG: DUF2332 domain-containing protein [Alphaproteobacteria bacterium]|nr:DUF2332 domain-containing protein [Alphaproteobacteria bacterium]